MSTSSITIGRDRISHSTATRRIRETSIRQTVAASWARQFSAAFTTPTDARPEYFLRTSIAPGRCCPARRLRALAPGSWWRQMPDALGKVGPLAYGAAPRWYAADEDFGRDNHFLLDRWLNLWEKAFSEGSEAELPGGLGRSRG